MSVGRAVAPVLSKPDFCSMMQRQPSDWTTARRAWPAPFRDRHGKPAHRL